MLKLVIHEGLNRVVRKMMDQYDVDIVRLRRTRVGPITMAGVKVGQSRELSAAEVAGLYEAVGLDDAHREDA